MANLDPALAAAREFETADAILSEAHGHAMTRADLRADAAEAKFTASVPTTAAGAIAKLRACRAQIARSMNGDRITEIGLQYLADQIEATIKGLAQPRLVWNSATPE